MKVIKQTILIILLISLYFVTVGLWNGLVTKQLFDGVEFSVVINDDANIDKVIDIFETSEQLIYKEVHKQDEIIIYTNQYNNEIDQEVEQKWMQPFSFREDKYTFSDISKVYNNGVGGVYKIESDDPQSEIEYINKQLINNNLGSVANIPTTSYHNGPIYFYLCILTILMFIFTILIFIFEGFLLRERFALEKFFGVRQKSRNHFLNNELINLKILSIFYILFFLIYFKYNLISYVIFNLLFLIIFIIVLSLLYLIKYTFANRIAKEQMINYLHKYQKNTIITKILKFYKYLLFLIVSILSILIFYLIILINDDYQDLAVFKPYENYYHFTLKWTGLLTDEDEFKLNENLKNLKIDLEEEYDAVLFYATNLEDNACTSFNCEVRVNEQYLKEQGMENEISQLQEGANNIIVNEQYKEDKDKISIEMNEQMYSDTKYDYDCYVKSICQNIEDYNTELNIIWTDKTTYFTYDPLIGKQGEVYSDIVVVDQNQLSVDNYLTMLSTGSLHFSTTSQYPYDQISYLIEGNNLQASIVETKNTLDGTNQKMIIEYQLLVALSITFIINLLIYFIFIYYLILIEYNVNQKKYSLMYFHGWKVKSIFKKQIYEDLLIIPFFIIIATIICIVLFKNIYLSLLLILILIIQILVSQRIRVYLLRKKNILKGER